MNIWILNHYAIPPDIPGGTRHYDFGRELVKQGHHVSILASGFSHRTRKEERLKKGQNYHIENINGVDFVWLRTSPYYAGNDRRRVVNMLSYGLRVVPLGIRLKEKPDVILASSPHPFAGLAGWILAKFKRARFIFEVRDLWPETFLEIGGYSSRSPVVNLLRMLERFLYQRAEKIIVLLPNASEYIIDIGIPGDKIIYIPNGVSPELFSNDTVQLPPELAELISNLKSRGKFMVGYAGAHGIADSLDTVIKTAKILQDSGIDKIHFLLIGDGAEKSKLVLESDRLNLSNIFFHGTIPKVTVPAFLKDMDALVITKKKTDLYRFGSSFLKTFDYMMAAKPVVWALESVNNPVAESGCGITVPPENAEAMAKAILKLCDLSVEERQKMGMRGYEYVMKHHSVPILVNKLLDALHAAVGTT